MEALSSGAARCAAGGTGPGAVCTVTKACAIIAPMSRPLPALLLATLLVGIASPARADITGFFGMSPSPDTKSAKGFAVGFGLLVVGFEFEYSSIAEDEIEL